MKGLRQDFKRRKGHRLGGRKGGSHSAYVAKIPRRTPGIEHKFYDTFLEDHAISPLGNMTGGNSDPSSTSLISTPAIGDGGSNRDGKRIVIDTIVIEGILQRFPKNEQTEIGGGLGGVTVFIALVQDTQTNGSSALSQNVWTNPAGGTSLCASPLKNLSFATRFKTLKVWRVFIPNPNAVNNFDVASISTQGVHVTFDGFLKVNIPVDFNGGDAAVVGSVVDNSLHIYSWKNSTVDVKMSYNARIRFIG